MGMISEFKEFAVRGNVIDLAVGVVIGGAFGKIVTSMVNDVIMPVIGKLVGGVNFNSLQVVLTPASMGPDGKEIAFTYFIQFTIGSKCVRLANITSNSINFFFSRRIGNILDMMIGLIHHWADEVIETAVYAYENGRRCLFDHIRFHNKITTLTHKVFSWFKPNLQFAA